MEEKYGLLKDVECKFAKTDPTIIEGMSKRLGIPIDHMKHMLRYNMFTVSQFADLSQLAISTITNKTRPLMIDGKYGTELDYCYPYQNKNGDSPKFIVRNEKSEKYLKA